MELGYRFKLSFYGFFFFFLCFLFLSDIIDFSWKWENRHRPSSFDGKNWITGFDLLLLPHLTVLASPAVPSFWKYWHTICSERREREKKGCSLRGHATSCGQQTNRRIGWSGRAKSRWRTRMMKRWDGPILNVPERGKPLVQRWRHTTCQSLVCQWSLLCSRRQKKMSLEILTFSFKMFSVKQQCKACQDTCLFDSLSLWYIKKEALAWYFKIPFNCTTMCNFFALAYAFKKLTNMEWFFSPLCLCPRVFILFLPLYLII